MSEPEKQQFLHNLRHFIEEQKSWLDTTLNFVGWNISELKKLTKDERSNIVSCCINEEHRIPEESLYTHLDKCEKQNGQYPEVIEISNIFENEKKISQLLENYDDLETVQKDHRSSRKNDQSESQSSKYLMELLAAERDAKRRRAAHRGKRVHTNKKSYTEVIRELISNQMETLLDYKMETSQTDKENLESKQKEIIQSKTDYFLGVGNKYFNGNPYKRWMTIAKEEQELIEKNENKNRCGKIHQHDKYEKQNVHHGEHETSKHYSRQSSSSKFRRNDTSHSDREEDKYSSHHKDKFESKWPFQDESEYFKRKRRHSSSESSSKKKSKKSKKTKKKKTSSKKKKSHHHRHEKSKKKNKKGISSF